MILSVPTANVSCRKIVGGEEKTGGKSRKMFVKGNVRDFLELKQPINAMNIVEF